MRRYKAAFFCVFLGTWIFLCSVRVPAETEEYEIRKTEASLDKTGELLIEKMELQEVQQLLDHMLEDRSFSIKDTLYRLLSGKQILSKEMLQTLVFELFFRELQQERKFFLEILFLIFVSAVFTNFSSAFGNTQVGEISFYVSYLFFFTLCMHAFTGLCESLSHVLAWITEFMRALAPAYFLAVAASVGAATAALFYEGVLVLAWMVEWALQSILLPGVSLYVLLSLINHMSKEEMLGKAAELTGTLMNWSLKTLLGVMAGLNLVRGLVSPVMDTLKRSTLGRVAGALPGIGNAVNAVTEVLLAGAVLVRNSLGLVFLLALLLAGLSPLVHYVFLSLVWRFLAAVAQPVSDKRLVSCLETMGEGCTYLFRIFLTAEFLCMLVLLILNA